MTPALLKVGSAFCEARVSAVPKYWVRTWNPPVFFSKSATTCAEAIEPATTRAVNIISCFLMIPSSWSRCDNAWIDARVTNSPDKFKQQRNRSCVFMFLIKLRIMDVDSGCNS